jgi:hypothetical protein
MKTSTDTSTTTVHAAIERACVQWGVATATATAANSAAIEAHRPAYESGAISFGAFKAICEYGNAIEKRAWSAADVERDAAIWAATQRLRVVEVVEDDGLPF